MGKGGVGGVRGGGGEEKAKITQKILYVFKGSWMLFEFVVVFGSVRRYFVFLFFFGLLLKQSPVGKPPPPAKKDRPE